MSEDIESQRDQMEGVVGRVDGREREDGEQS